MLPFDLISDFVYENDTQYTETSSHSAILIY